MGYFDRATELQNAVEALRKEMKSDMEQVMNQYGKDDCGFKTIVFNQPFISDWYGKHRLIVALRMGYRDNALGDRRARFFIEYKDGENETGLTPMNYTRLDVMAQIFDHAKTALPEDAVIRQYRNLKAKHPEAVILFRCGDYYETYMNDAVAVAKTLGLALNEDGEYQVASFPFHCLDTYLPRLIRAGFRVAFCDSIK